jgi:hypothetical protein
MPRSVRLSHTPPPSVSRTAGYFAAVVVAIVVAIFGSGTLGACSSGAGAPAAGSGGQTPPTGGVTGSSGGRNGATGGSTDITGGTTGGTGGTTGTTGGTTGTAGGSAASTGGAMGGGGRTAGGGAAGPGGSGGSIRAVAGLPEYWIAPNGLDSNPGTEASPFLTVNAAQLYAVAGTTIWVKAGTYTYVAIVEATKSGTATNPIKVWAVAGARPVFDFMLQPRGNDTFRGINIKGDYWHIRGIEIRNTGDNCINISGSHNTVEQVVVHNCMDSGIQITADSNLAADATRAAFNTILNCDSYDNYDSDTQGENADGFAAKLYIGAGNVFRGCRAFNNSDDGWDLFAANDVVTIDNCWAFLNGVTSTGARGPAGDGNGFKLGGAPDSGDPNMGGAVHRVTNSFSFDNSSCGFVRNNNPQVPTVAMSGARNNPRGDFCNLTGSGNVTITETGAQGKAAVRNADGSLPAIR